LNGVGVGVLVGMLVDVAVGMGVGVGGGVNMEHAVIAMASHMDAIWNIAIRNALFMISPFLF
jgi:hypothetical protein